MREQNEVRFDHIAFGARRMVDAVDFLVGELGGARVDGGPGFEYEGGQWSFEGGGRLEVIVPMGPPGGFMHRFLERRGPGIHHTTFTVPDLKEACAKASALGYDVVGYNDAIPSWKEAFLHPKQALGIVIQLAESDPSIEGGWSADWGGFPPEPAPRGARARVVGLRVSVRSKDQALRQWGELLDGTALDDEHGVVFTWPRSPLRLAATIDPSREPGPVAVEVVTDRPLPKGEHPLLGARFCRPPR